MSSKSIQQDVESTTITTSDDCPECGGDLYYDPMCVHGGPTEATGGVACLDCTWYEVEDNPMAVMEPDGELIEDSIKLGSTIVSTDHDRFDAEKAVFTKPDGCKECGGSLEVYLIQNEEPRGWGRTHEWEAVADSCTDCGCRNPSA